MEQTDSRLREQHSLMEGERSASYAIFADAQEYWFSYDYYLKAFQKAAAKKDVVRVLNIGAATGIMEFLALQTTPNLHFVSIDNSSSFRDMFCQKNKEWIEQGKIEYVLSSIQDFQTDHKFDFIVSRDVNHHLEKDDIQRYIKQCSTMLDEGGSFIMEDLKSEAEKEGISDLVRVVYDIPEFRDDKTNRYHKILGIIDSYFVAYSTSEMEKLIKALNLKYTVEDEKYRYMFIIRANA